jgi:hypothetical protein
MERRAENMSGGAMRQLGRATNTSMRNPEEGARLIRALLSIEDPEARRALIALAEALASRKG